MADGDGAHSDGTWFFVTRSMSASQHTVLTLRSKDVVWAEVVKDGRVIERVLGADRGQT